MFWRYCPWNPKATARGCRGWWKELRDGPFLSFHWSHPRVAQEGYLAAISFCETLGHGGSWSQELNLAHRSNSFYPQARQGVTFPVHALSATPSRIWSAADCRGWYHCSRPVRLGLSTPSKIAGYPINLVLNGQFDGTNIWICWMSVESLCSPHHSTW